MSHGDADVHTCKTRAYTPEHKKQWLHLRWHSDELCMVWHSHLHTLVLTRVLPHKHTLAHASRFFTLP